MRAAALVVGVRVGLWVLPFRTVRALLDGRRRRTRPPDGPLVDRAARAVRVVARYVPRATCLTQALALAALLGRLGQPAHVRIGVRKGGGGALEAHAWVESRGRVIIGRIRGLARYTALAPPGRPTPS
jgi:hypothetical protein